MTDTDLGYDAILGALLDAAAEDGASVLVGIRGEQGEDLVTYAAANEFGVPQRIEERSFLRSTVNDNEEAYLAELGKAVDNLVNPEGVPLQRGPARRPG